MRVQPIPTEAVILVRLSESVEGIAIARSSAETGAQHLAHTTMGFIQPNKVVVLSSQPERPNDRAS
jgi:hypothetical protein